MVKKKVAVLGSTGSVGVNVLRVISALKDKFKIVGLATNKNLRLLKKQIGEFRPEIVAVQDPVSFSKLKKMGMRAEIYLGSEGIIQVATHKGVELVVICISGASALLPLVESIKSKKEIALASKEPLVMAGELIHRLCQEYQVKIIPIDSEHNAIFQCLNGRDIREVRRVILTSSGGPFHRIEKEKLKDMEPSEALKHPRWKMGKKISVDSAILMNKGLEIIEARWLFNLPVEKIEVLIHPEAIVHSLVEFIDGSTLALLGITDMRLPIQYALTYPRRLKTDLKYLELSQIKNLTFEKPDLEKFPSLKLAYNVAHKGKSFPCVLNACDEVCVEAFLAKRLKLTEIPEIISRVLRRHRPIPLKKVEDVLSVDSWARKETEKIISKR